ncbi:hypothetical protein RclHR1_24700001 [Rhizophagus clarus]|uniref:Uncharacterized protein n=1 Tax=Rhizophagus clarus TaxID=94130 RepID=A0A2Z6QYD4_9GLOM|nr:hypothetical protein RclHR1_24700001 [Rhizophagus clarus]
MRDINFSDHNPVTTYYDHSFLFSSIKLARARQLKRRSHYIFLFDSVTPSQWDDFSTHIDKICNTSSSIFASWHVNRMCEYLHTNIIAGANAVLPACTVGNDHTPKLPKDLETLLQHYHFLNRILYSIRLLHKYPRIFSSSHFHKWSHYVTRLNIIFSLYKSIFSAVPVLPLTLSSCQTDNFNQLFATLSHASKSLRGLHLLKEKEFQDSTIKVHIETCDQNFDTDISSFINSVLSCSHPKDISDAVVNYFQNAVPIRSTPPSRISALLTRWRSEYSPMDAVSPDIYKSLLSPPFLKEWLSMVFSMLNGKASDLIRKFFQKIYINNYHFIDKYRIYKSMINIM